MFKHSIESLDLADVVIHETGKPDKKIHGELAGTLTVYYNEGKVDSQMYPSLLNTEDFCKVYGEQVEVKGRRSRTFLLIRNLTEGIDKSATYIYPMDKCVIDQIHIHNNGCSNIMRFRPWEHPVAIATIADIVNYANEHAIAYMGVISNTAYSITIDEAYAKDDMEQFKHNSTDKTENKVIVQNYTYNKPYNNGTNGVHTGNIKTPLFFSSTVDESRSSVITAIATKIAEGLDSSVLTSVSSDIVTTNDDDDDYSFYHGMMC